MSDPNQANPENSGQCWTTTQAMASCDTPAQNSKLSPEELLACSRSINEWNGVSMDTPCQQQLVISIFFDGTGNNRYVDEPLNKMSNVARLFKAHSSKENQFPIYVNGLGTKFKEIRDEGGPLGMAVGQHGEARLRFAMEQFDSILRNAEARARNPTNKIKGIHLAIFGFSRGAAAARAFAVRFHQRLTQSDSGWVLAKKHYPVRVYFMGLFDTVASVGISNAVRRTPASKAGFEGTVGWMEKVGEADVARAQALSSGLGAKPLVLVKVDRKGHNAWGEELRIPPSVMKCVHHVAAHEVRQSFPLDTVRVSKQAGDPRRTMYPSQCKEVVYPGVHSNVGGGYAPGETGRSAALNEQLALIPLLEMYREARNAGVPLRRIDELPEGDKALFQLSEEDQQRFLKGEPLKESQTKLRNLFWHYMEVVKPSGCVEEQMAQHLYWLYRWRKLRATLGLEPYQRNMLEQREVLRRQLAQEEARARSEVLSQMKGYPDATPYIINQGVRNDPKVQGLREKLEAHQKVYDQIDNEDRRFLDKMLSAHDKYTEGKPLTLNEEKLVDAYNAPPLDDKDVIDFFDNHVHDSVADFRSGAAGATDASTVGEPRDVFSGDGPWGMGPATPIEREAHKQRLSEINEQLEATNQSMAPLLKQRAALDGQARLLQGTPAPDLNDRYASINQQLAPLQARKRQLEEAKTRVELAGALSERVGAPDDLLSPLQVRKQQLEGAKARIESVGSLSERIGKPDDLLNKTRIPNEQQIKTRAVEQAAKQLNIPGGI